MQMPIMKSLIFGGVYTCLTNSNANRLSRKILLLASSYLYVQLYALNLCIYKIEELSKSKAKIYQKSLIFDIHKTPAG